MQGRVKTMKVGFLSKMAPFTPNLVGILRGGTKKGGIDLPGTSSSRGGSM
jgi:hypothetical protein